MNHSVADETARLPVRRRKSFWLAFWLALFFGPLGLLYISWQRCLIMLLPFLAAFFFIPGETGAVMTSLYVFRGRTWLGCPSRPLDGR